MVRFIGDLVIGQRGIEMNKRNSRECETEENNVVEEGGSYDVD